MCGAAGGGELGGDQIRPSSMNCSAAVLGCCRGPGRVVNEIFTIIHFEEIKNTFIHNCIGRYKKIFSCHPDSSLGCLSARLFLAGDLVSKNPQSLLVIKIFVDKHPNFQFLD